MKILKWAKRVCLGVVGFIILLLAVGFVYEHIARTTVHKAFPAGGRSVLIGGPFPALSITGEWQPGRSI